MVLKVGTEAGALKRLEAAGAYTVWQTSAQSQDCRTTGPIVDVLLRDKEGSWPQRTLKEISRLDHWMLTRSALEENTGRASDE